MRIVKLVVGLLVTMTRNPIDLEAVKLLFFFFLKRHSKRCKALG